MRSAGGVLGGTSLEQVEPFWAYVAAYKGFVQQRGVHRECGGGVIWGGCRRSVGEHLS